ncbi:MAG: cytochrome c family protein [Alphaproteobacteria bacterium]
MNRLFATALACGIALTLAGQAAAADPAKGKRVFNKCKACHSLKAGKKKIGPSLNGVFGRTSGTGKGFKYSKAMIKAAIVWDDKTMDAFITKPRKMIKRTRMAFPGIKKASDRANLIAYLKQATK